jgi:two-component system, NtrC family, sensor histidine kinase HydH
MASTRVAPLARWSAAAAVALMGAALAVTAWTTRTSVRDARDTLLRGERATVEQSVRADLGELDGAAGDGDLATILATHKNAGLRYLAVIDPSGAVLASAGASAPDRRDRIELRGPRRFGRPGGFPGPGARRGGGRVVLELEPVAAEALDAAATRTLAIGIAAAALLGVVAVLAVRWMLRREAAARALEHQQRLASLGELSAVLAHEIRNPLASLKGNAQLLAASLPAGERPRQKAERVVEEAIRLETLTNDLLEFVRKGTIARAAVDPAALVRERAAQLPDAAGAVEVVADGAPATWPLDAARIGQVLTNLIDNAIAAGPPVRVAITTARDRLIIEIRDHGPGVAPGDAERIFEPFFTSKSQGTGLGLTVARRIVEQHGGTIAVGAAPGGGACFRIELPRTS